MAQRSDARFGLTDGEWEAAVAEVREAILDAAVDRRMTSYSEVAAKVRVVHVEPYSTLLNRLLGAVFAQEHAAGGPALTALVTHRSGDLEPGAGFYDMARSLGCRFSEPYVFWAEEVQKVFTQYGTARRGR